MKRRMLLACSITTLLCIPFGYAAADIYQYTDDSGVIHFSNVSLDNPRSRRKVKITKEAKQDRTETRESHSVSPRTTTASPVMTKAPKAYTDLINDACDRHGVDPALVHAIVKVESDFNPYALSRKGAMGLMQLMPQTALNMNVQNTFNPQQNIDGGVKYLRYLMDRYEGNLSLALAAYNSGETAVKKWGTVPPFPETQSYVQKILTLYNGTGITTTPQYTIYIGYGDDGALLFTDDPSKHSDKKLKRKIQNNL